MLQTIARALIVVACWPVCCIIAVAGRYTSIALTHVWLCISTQHARCCSHRPIISTRQLFILCWSFAAQVVAYHEAIRDDIRQAALAQFLAPVEANDQSTILVCTDRTSRGIDSMYCQHVVLFDFPRDPSEYVRRVGRTARGAGGRGVVSVLVIGKQVPLAQEIIARNKKGAPIHRIPEIAERYH